MIDAAFLELPLFEPRHRELGARAAAVVSALVEPRASDADAGDPDRAAKDFLRLLAAEGLLRHLVPSQAAPQPDLRSVCLLRETLAFSSALADAALAVQGLGSYPIGLAGTPGHKQRYLPQAAEGEAVAAFALTEPGAGSDVGAVATTARRDGGHYVLDGVKTLISNAAIADFFVVFAKTDPAAGGRGLSAFVVDRDTPGMRIGAPIQLMAPHSIAGFELTACRVPAAQRLGEEGDGLKLALATLDFFRSSVGAAACGMAARGLAEAKTHVVARRQFGSALSDFQATKLALAEMAVDLDAARLLVYRAAWTKDHTSARVTREASMAKLYATEAAQRVVDRAVQLHGGLGVQRGVVVERLYREVRALRIYEGTSEIQRLVIADQVLRS